MAVITEREICQYKNCSYKCTYNCSAHCNERQFSHPPDNHQCSDVIKCRGGVFSSFQQVKSTKKTQDKCEKPQTLKHQNKLTAVAQKPNNVPHYSQTFHTEKATNSKSSAFHIRLLWWNSISPQDICTLILTLGLSQQPRIVSVTYRSSSGRIFHAISVSSDVE